MTRPKSAMVVLAVLLTAGGRVAAQPPCVGDCNHNDAVAINELIIGVNIALGNFSVDQCPSFDSNWNGMVAINELIQAVNAALNGCVVTTPTPGTPTATPTGTEPAATATPDEVVEEVAGAAAAVANSLSSIVNVVGAVVAGAAGGAAAGGASGGLTGGGAGGTPDPCELGGTVFSDIEVVFPVANITIEFNMCEVSRPGGSVVFDGSLSVTGLNLQFRGNGAFNATIEFKDDQGQTSAVTQADIQSPIALAVTPGGVDPCAVDIPVLGSQLIAGVDMTMLTGTLDSIVPDQGSARVAFQNTAVELDILASDDDCIPTSFELTFDGDSEITQSAGATEIAFDLEFVSFLLSAVQSGDQSLVTMTGDLISSCFGGMITLGTPQQLSFLLGQFCPGAGIISVEDIGEVVYSAQGVSANGMTFASCLDPALLQCVQ